MKSLGTLLLVGAFLLTTDAAFAQYRFRDSGGAKSQSQPDASNRSGRDGQRRDGVGVGGSRGSTGIGNSRVNSAISGGRARGHGRGR